MDRAMEEGKGTSLVHEQNRANSTLMVFLLYLDV